MSEKIQRYELIAQALFDGEIDYLIPDEKGPWIKFRDYVKSDTKLGNQFCGVIVKQQKEIKTLTAQVAELEENPKHIITDDKLRPLLKTLQTRIDKAIKAMDDPNKSVNYKWVCIRAALEGDKDE